MDLWWKEKRSGVGGRKKSSQRLLCITYKNGSTSTLCLCGWAPNDAVNLRHYYFFGCSVCFAASKKKQSESEREKVFFHGNNGHCQGFIFILPKSRKSAPVLLTFTRCFFVRRAHAIVSIHLVFTIHMGRFGRRPVDFDFLLTHMDLIPFERSSIRRRQCTLHTPTQTCAADKKADDLFPYLFI